jgi:hypothetical protein
VRQAWYQDNQETAPHLSHLSSPTDPSATPSLKGGGAPGRVLRKGKGKEEEKERVRGRSKARGRVYIDAAHALRRLGHGGKSGESQRYTVRGGWMPGGCRRWRAAEGRCNGSRLPRPACRPFFYLVTIAFFFGPWFIVSVGSASLVSGSSKPVVPGSRSSADRGPLWLIVNGC